MRDSRDDRSARRTLLLFATAVAAWWAPACGAEAPPSIRSLYFENDLFAPNNEDRWYSQGIRIAESYDMSKASSEFRAPLHRLTDWWCGESRTSCSWRGWQLGHAIFTPSDITAEPPNPRDRPWSAWLYGGASAQKVTLDRDNVGIRLQSLEVDLGVIGPAAQGKFVQREWHQLIGSPEPLWNNNLKSEPTLFIDYQDRHRLAIGAIPVKLADFVAHYGANVGNVMTTAYAGLTLRAGKNVSGFGNYTIRPTDSPGTTLSRRPPSRDGSEAASAGEIFKELYGFVFAEGRYVAFNAFLDGNLFRSDSPSVDKKRFVADLGVGGTALLWNDLRITYTLVKRSKEFNAPQDVIRDTQLYGSLTVSRPYP